MFRSALKILKITDKADKEAIHNAYVRLVRRYPPEHFPEKFKIIQKAYHELTLDGQIVNNIVHQFGKNDNKFEIAAYFCADHLNLSSNDHKLEGLTSFLFPSQPDSNVKNIIEKLDLSKVQYRRVNHKKN
ncbi:MAG: J domain-containing protein [Deltaproteobacteria bacterium]|jgi:DnaJ-class molecular chaperone|nr:J domain-containing protein [Deltaproteobacteria bacterium]